MVRFICWRLGVINIYVESYFSLCFLQAVSENHLISRDFFDYYFFACTKHDTVMEGAWLQQQRPDVNQPCLRCPSPVCPSIFFSQLYVFSGGKHVSVLIKCASPCLVLLLQLSVNVNPFLDITPQHVRVLYLPEPDAPTSEPLINPLKRW